MRKIAKEMAEAFNNCQPFKKSNTTILKSDKQIILTLFGNIIAVKSLKDGFTMITNAGYKTRTTKDRLNALPNVRINQKNGVWYLNGEEWNGEFKQID